MMLDKDYLKRISSEIKRKKRREKYRLNFFQETCGEERSQANGEVRKANNRRNRRQITGSFTESSKTIKQLFVFHSPFQEGRDVRRKGNRGTAV